MRILRVARRVLESLNMPLMTEYLYMQRDEVDRKKKQREKKEGEDDGTESS